MYGYTKMVFAFFTKGNNFYHFLFVSLEDGAIPKWGLFLKERICLEMSVFFFPFTADPH